jgi:uncharacterized protein (TIGR00303 family)
MTQYNNDQIKIYTAKEQGIKWLHKYTGKTPIFSCILGFTETALIEGISTAGATPESRLYTAVADAEFLVNGVQPHPHFALPPLHVGVSPVFITRAVVERFNLPTFVFNAGLKFSPPVPHIDLDGQFAQCVSTGKALPLATVKHLYQQGWKWGEKLANQAESSYLILSECVVGGTTTALALLTALGISAKDKVNSSHPICNHQQKWSIVKQGLKNLPSNLDPFSIISAIGDPMQIVVAGMAISASQKVGVMLAGGTQMLAVFALIKDLQKQYALSFPLENIIVGTTRWVAEDHTGDTVTLAHLIGDVSLCSTQLNFSRSQYTSLQKYEEGFVKEGVGAGGSAISAHLLGLNNRELLILIETILSRFHTVTNSQ